MVSFSRSVWKKLHRAEKIYTGSARDNYEVCIHLHLGIEEPLRPLMEKQIPKLLLKYQDDDASPRSLATRTFTQRWWLRSSLGSYFPPD